MTAIESCLSDESESRIEGSEEVRVNSSSDVLPEMESVTFEELRKMLKKMVQKDFIELQKCKRSLLTYQAMYKGAQVIVDVESTVLLFEGPCRKESVKKKQLWSKCPKLVC